MKKNAVISDCGKYRYSLSRIWDDSKPKVMFIMLNPSTADGEKDDPTIRRCIRFAKDWGYGGLHVVNLFALRATNPKELISSRFVVGVDNRKYISLISSLCEIVVCAWGNGAIVDKLQKRLDHTWKPLSWISKPLHYEYGNEIVKLKEGYSKAIDSENEFKLKYIEVDEKYNKLVKSDEDNILQIKKIKSCYDENCLNGYWLFSSTAINKNTIRDVLYFNNGLVHKKISKSEHKPYGKIVLFSTDENQTKFSFVINVTDTIEETNRLKSLYKIKKFSALELSTLVSPSIRIIDVLGKQNNIFEGAENFSRNLTVKKIADDDFNTQMILDYDSTFNEDEEYIA